MFSSNSSGGGLSAWIPSLAYNPGDTVLYNNTAYVCKIAASGSVFQTDLALNKWRPIDLPQINENLFTSSQIFEDAGVGGWTGTGCATVTNGLPASVAGAGLNFNSSNGGRALGGNTTAPAVFTGQFTVTSANATAGATYTNNSLVFTVNTTISGGTTLSVTGGGINLNGTTLTKASGTGDATITFSVYTPPINGAYSLNLATSGAGTIGDGYISPFFPISKRYQAQMLSIKFSYQVISGTPVLAGTSSNTYAAAVYDVANATWYGVQGNFNFVQGTGVGQFTGTFQTASNSTGFQLFIYSPVAPTGVSSLLLDDFYIGPQVSSVGPAMSDWVAYTPTGSWSTNTTYSGFWRRIGDTMEIQAKALCSGAPTSASLYFNMPTGYTMDTTKLQSVSTIGIASMQDSGVNSYTGEVQYISSGQLAVYTTVSPATAVTQAVPFTFGNADYVTINVSVPIVGWSSNTVQSADTDTRVVAASYQLSTNPSIANSTATALGFDTKLVDTHGAFNSGSSTFTAPMSGIYEVSATINWAANATNGRELRVYNNGSLFAELAYSGTPGSFQFCQTGTATKFLNAGDTLAIEVFQNSGGALALAGGAQYNFVSFKRLSGPAVVQASEVVNVEYADSAGTYGATTVVNAITMNTKEIDTHSAFNGTTGIFTAPKTATYLAKVTLTSSFSVGSTASYSDIIITSSAGPSILARGDASATAAMITQNTVAKSFRLLTGQTLTFTKQATYGSGTATIFANTQNNSLSIMSIGN